MKYRGVKRFKDDWNQFPKLQDKEGYVLGHYAHGAVIDETLLPQVGASVASICNRKARKSKTGDTYLLSGILRAVDGTPYYGESAKQGIYQYYKNRNSAARVNRFEIEGLATLCRALSGDGRKAKKREYPYWELVRWRQVLIEFIASARQRGDRGNDATFAVACEALGVKPPFETLLLNPDHAPAELAIDVLVAPQRVESRNAFRTVLAHVNGVRVRHGLLVKLPVVEWSWRRGGPSSPGMRPLPQDRSGEHSQP